MIELVLFDMDGVIFEGINFWLDLHKRMGTEKQAWQLWNGLGTKDYGRLSAITAKNLWRNKSSEQFWQLISERQPVENIGRVFDYLNRSNIKTAIISSGPYQLAEKAQRLFQVREIRANKLLIDGMGRFTGEVDVQVDDNHKDIPAKEVMHKLGVEFNSTAMIGDTRSDLGIANMVSLPIAYNSDDCVLLAACRYRLSAGEIDKVVDLIQEYRGREEATTY
jgi:HAD superfamily phosphoserine phosphatase-like hydrolase